MNQHAEITAQGLLVNLLRQGKMTEAAAEIRASAAGRDRIPTLDPHWAAALRPAVVAVSGGQRGRDLGSHLFSAAALGGAVQHPTILPVDALTLIIRDTERRPDMAPLADIIAGYILAARSAGAAHTGEAAA